ncbi:hypothetical protein TWF506_004546 [Arthrobotrys conoides]|uniref:Uncharacterized protein n=1 Tax=Arthrobotrys conoides TaxID=74498 RepID=A0AAN8N2B1_9PEZI
MAEVGSLGASFRATNTQGPSGVFVAAHAAEPLNPTKALWGAIGSVSCLRCHQCAFPSEGRCSVDLGDDELLRPAPGRGEE